MSANIILFVTNYVNLNLCTRNSVQLYRTITKVLNSLVELHLMVDF